MTLLPVAIPPEDLPLHDTVIMSALRASVILASRTVPRSNWPDLLRYLETQHGASLILPDPASTWASHMAELTAFGITGRGATAEEAFEEWCKAARRSISEKDAA